MKIKCTSPCLPYLCWQDAGIKRNVACNARTGNQCSPPKCAKHYAYQNYPGYLTSEKQWI